jgi:hypothetical protein
MKRLSPGPLVIALVLLSLAILLTAPAFGQVVLVPTGSTWKYLDNGTDLGSAWRQPAFNDSAWLAGPAQLGYGDRDETTVVGYGPDRKKKYINTYFRHSFDVPDPSQYRGLKLRLLRDDGAIVYINGAEIVRSNIPSGKVNYLTRASSNVTGSDEDKFYEFFVDPRRLVVGTNVLAVEVHQSSATSSDLSFDLELITTGVMRKAPYLVYEGDNTKMKILWQLNSTAPCAINWGVDTLYSLGNEQTSEFGSDHQHAYTITNMTPSSKYYYRITADTNTFTRSFRAAPPSYATHTNLIVYGDSRSYPADHDQVADAIVSTCSADSSFQSVIVSVGDLVNDGDQESDWDTELFDAGYSHIQEMLGSMPYQVAMGNHERSGKLFSKYFPYPFAGGRYWSFDYGPAHFVMVDQYTDYSTGSPQLNWIESDLASTTKPWKFLVMHEPGWSAGGHTNNTSVQNYLQPLCEEYGVAIVFAGHNHYYARAEVNGVEHITTGGGGAPLSPPDTSYPNVVTGTETLHYCKIEIDGSLLRFTAVTPAGDVIDKFTLDRVLAGHKPIR